MEGQTSGCAVFVLHLETHFIIKARINVIFLQIKHYYLFSMQLVLIPVFDILSALLGSFRLEAANKAVCDKIENISNLDTYLDTSIIRVDIAFDVQRLSELLHCGSKFISKQGLINTTVFTKEVSHSGVCQT